MELYRYKAVDADGRLQRGQADAVNPIDLEMRLTRLGLDLVNYRPVKPGGLFAVRQRIKRRDLITFCFHMEQLLEAGVPMIDALTDLRDSLENRRLQEITAAMIESIQGGKALSEAMRDFPHVFSTVFVNLVRAREGSGTLTRVLRHMIDHLKWQDEQAAHTKRLFIYPIVVAVVVGGAMFSLMVFVVPELLKFVRSMGQELPLHTGILIAVSGAFASYWPFFLFALVFAILAIMAGIKYSQGFRLWYDALLLGIPLFGVILKKLILTRISTYFALMYSSGITVLECLKVAEDIAGNRAVEEALRPTPFSDYIYAHLLLKKRPGNHYVQAEDLKYYRLHQARSGMLLGSAAILLLAVVGGGRNLVEGLKLRQSATSAEQRAGIYQAQFNAAKRRLPETPVEPKDIKTAVDIADTLSRYKATPLQMMRAVSRALDRYPELRIQSLNWLSGTDPKAAVEGEPRAAEDTSAPGSTPPGNSGDLYYQIAVLTGEIRPFDGDFRAALDRINGFAAALRARPAVRAVTVLNDLFDVDPAGELKGSADEATRPEKAEFTVKIVLGVGRAAG